MRNFILYTLLSLVLVAMLFFANRAYTQAKNYEMATSLLVEYGTPKNLAKYKLNELAESLSFGIFKNAKKDDIVKLNESAEQNKKLSQENTIYFMSLLLLVLASFFLLTLREFTFFASLTAMITLVYGLVTPIMMVTIHKEVEYLGDVILSFESKSVLGSIEKLFETGDIVVASTILLFSIIIPVVKTLSLAFVAMFMRNNFAHSIVKFFKLIGKWSMVDVFVVASTILLFSLIIPVVKTLSLAFVAMFMRSNFAHSIVKFFKLIGKWSMVDVFVVASFLVYLTLNKGNVSRAEVEVGLYYFLAYVIVSMFVSLSADKMLHRGE